ncbi:histamine H1 receptor-like isoform X4 [Neocloeon triangulifer]|uniref:histamine H1 receptor-like isoform X4 n=1 Tax=Neocloeon triangulifer TaxID=2078957 RepID=UPI00286F3BD9|nr:histamine H1 receptor-like isoform X4 [Neocloeon triangulifer]
MGKPRQILLAGAPIKVGSVTTGRIASLGGWTCLGCPDFCCLPFTLARLQEKKGAGTCLGSSWSIWNKKVQKSTLRRHSCQSKTQFLFFSSSGVTVSNMFIMSLAAADLTVGAIVMPISSMYALTGRWVLGLAVCQFWLSADYTASTASIFNLFILSVDRYWSITSPLRYLRKRTKKRALIMIGLVWVVSCMWIVPIISWHHVEHSGERRNPADVCETEFAANVAFKVTAAIFNFYFPTVLMVYLYGRIFFEIKKRSRFEIGHCTHGRVGSGGGDAADDSLAEDPRHWTSGRRSARRGDGLALREWKRHEQGRQLHQFRNLTVLSYREEAAAAPAASDETMNDALAHFEGITVNVEYVGAANDTARTPSTRGGSSGGPQRRSRVTRTQFWAGQGRRGGRGGSDAIVLAKEKKAARQLGVIMGAFVLCWLPYFVLFTVVAFCEDCVDPKFHTATIWLGYVNSTLNPVLYPLCNANFKRAFKRMLGFRPLPAPVPRKNTLQQPSPHTFNNM